MPDLLSVSDIELIGERVSLNSAAILMIIERAATRHLERAISAFDARMVLHGRVPPDVAIAALDEANLLWHGALAEIHRCVCPTPDGARP